jgi:hypothetical protein
MRFLKSVSTRLDEASTAGKEKKTKNTAAFAHSPFKTTAFVIMACFFVFFSLAGVASANEPWWHIESGSEPANIPPGGEGKITVTVADLGDADINGGTGSPVKIVDTLPPGLKATAIVAEANNNQGIGNGSGSVGSCTEATLTCEYTGVLADYNQIQVVISVKAGAGAHSGELNHATVSGGGTPRAVSVAHAITISETPTPYGVENYEMTPETETGGIDTQAGSQPFQLTTTLDLNQALLVVEPPAQAKDLRFDLPPGLVGNPTVFPQCSEALFLTAQGEGDFSNVCPDDTAVGVAEFTVYIRGHAPGPIVVPLFNLPPEVGEPARFGFYFDQVPVYLDTSVRTGEGYGVRVSVDNITQEVEFISSRVTFWGVPGEASHDNARGWSCIDDEHALLEYGPDGIGPCTAPSEPHPAPLLSLPTSCTEPLQTSVETDSWTQEGAFQTFYQNPLDPLPALDGCTKLPFKPEIRVSPDVQEASKPSGLKVDVHVPQSVDLDSEGLSASDVKNITVALPAGVAINPSSGGGLQACSSEPSALGAGVLGSPGDQVGYEGERELDPVTEPGVRHPAFTHYLPGSFDALGAGYPESLQPGLDFCANASKIAEVTIHSPLLPNPLTGFVYLAAQEANPFGSLFAMYLVAEDPVSGSLVKLPGEVQLCKGAGEVIDGDTCEALGQIVSTFANNPQLPFEDAELDFFGGERAPLANPSRCGAYTTSASFAPWSGNEAANVSSTFDIDQGPNHSPCPGASLPFSPSLTGGALNVNAGAFSPFDATMTRQSGEQNLQSLEVRLPPGLSGILSGVELCPEPQANLGECGENSKIGETTVSVGVGGEPYTVSGGKFYLTGPYNGTSGCTVGEANCAPFGITFTVPAKAGPYDFAKTKDNHPACDCVLVRAKIEINPITAAITITSNPPGTPDSIPTSLEGIPLEIQHINAITTRNDFQFNPTNCAKMEVTGTIHSSENTTDTIGVPFQVTNCKSLSFTPKFTVSTQGKTSKADGASLTTKVEEPAGSLTTQTNIAYVKVELPKQLPSRLTTLQKACLAKVFEANPAACPSASDIGHAVVHTPLLPVPLEGPAIFVSHGGEAFPSLEIVLQGYGVTIDLVGQTYISKSGITSTTFHTVPDQPFSSFELTLPEGPYSALAANGNLCALTTTKTVKKKVTVKVHGHKKTETRKVKEAVAGTLQMPNEFVGQNGAVIRQTTAIGVTGCARSVPAKKIKQHKGKKARK